MNVEHWWNDTDREKLKFLEKNLFQCHCVPTNPTWTSLRLKPGLHGDRPATNCLSHNTACIISNVTSTSISHQAKWPLQYPLKSLIYLFIAIQTFLLPCGILGTKCVPSFQHHSTINFCNLKFCL